MGREQRVEERTRGTKIQVQSTFVFVGAPGTNKRRFSNELAADYFTEKLAVQSESYPSYAPLGFSADYRIELKIAADRATRLGSTEKPMLYTHSLIDSLAYSLARVEVQVNFGAGGERLREVWALTMGICGTMLRDTLKADEILFLTADFDPDTHYEQAKIQTLQAFILDAFEYDYTVIDVDQEDAIDDIARVIAGHIA